MLTATARHASCSPAAVIVSPAEFTPGDPDELKRQSAADPRLAEAVACSPGRKVIEYLAGVPLLMDRYEGASTPARALIHAAMDARRMGHGKALPVELLANAAPGYMSADDPDLYGGSGWLAAALADASGPLASGIAGPLTLVRRVRGTGADKKPDQNSPGNRRLLPARGISGPARAAGTARHCPSAGLLGRRPEHHGSRPGGPGVLRAEAGPCPHGRAPEQAGHTTERLSARKLSGS